MRRKSIIAFSLVFLAGCGVQKSIGNTAFDYVVKYMQIGSSTDYWLVKGSFSIDDRVGLIFGYMNDMEGCQDIAASLNQKYPQAMYTCRNAN